MTSVTLNVSTSTVTTSTKNSFLRTCGAMLLKLCRFVAPSAVNSPVTTMSYAGLPVAAGMQLSASNSNVPHLMAKLFDLGRYLAPCAVSSPVAYLAYVEDSANYGSASLPQEQQRSFGRYLLPSSVNSPVSYMALAYASPMNHSENSAANAAAPVLQNSQGEHSMSTFTDRIINALSAPITATATVIAQQYAANQAANQEAMTSAAEVKAQNFVRPEKTLRVGEAIVNALSAPVTATATVIAQQYEAEQHPAAATALAPKEHKIVAMDFNAAQAKANSFMHPEQAQAVGSKALRTNFGSESALAAYATQRLARIMPRPQEMAQPVAVSSLPASAESNSYTATFGEYAALADYSRKFAGMQYTPEQKNAAVLPQHMQTAADTSRYTAQFGDYAALADFARNFANASTAMSAVLKAEQNYDREVEMALPQVTAESKSYTASFGEYAALADFARNFAGASTAMSSVLKAEAMAMPQATLTASFGEFAAIADFARNFAGATTAMSMVVKAQPQENSNEVIAAIKHEFVLLQAHNAADEAACELNLARNQEVAARWQAIVAQLSAPELKHPVHLGAFNEMQPQQHSA
ncbi:MAG: hypothetical protein H9847_01405 [Candidatus Anaerobiospirillum pullicola]|uniref:Uncharacterized protein n=1 Tax=Candidatus Anaerobiospirillum pullicola TaxID=2838451 RepID=A0A948WX68_9GAMM|nr:hypothetical protein [Candidatus Anaerobiospirillum pullicola]